MTDICESGRVAGLALWLTLLASCTGCSSPPVTSDEDDPLLVSGCAGPAGADRWASGVSGYHAARTFGQRVGEELVHPVGVAAAADGRSVLFDLGLPSVITIDSHLREIRRFGRAGRGPAEFDPVTPLRLNIAQETWVAASDSVIVTSSGGRLDRFSWNGEVRGSHTMRTGALPLGLLMLSVKGIFLTAGGETLLSVAVRPPWAAFNGTLVFRADPDSLIVLDSVVGPQLPQDGGRFVTPPGQAQSRVLLWGDCLLSSDGASPWWHLRDLESGLRDSILLPSFEVRPPAPLTQEQIQERQRLTRAGGLNIRVSEVPPSALNRWRAAIVDPDGVLWLWPDHKDGEGEGVEVLRVSLRTRRAHWDTVPAFPAAFTLPGAFVAFHEDDDTGIRFLTLYGNSLR